LVAAIHEYKGEQKLFIETKPDILKVIAESIDDTERIRFKPLSSFETPDPLLLIPMFIFDFLCIHPFNARRKLNREAHLHN